jgi:hypothetical protein
VAALSVPLPLCAAGQCCGGAVIFGKCIGIGCTCFCPATNGKFGCMRDAAKFLVSNPSELAKCGKAAQRSASLAQGCATGDMGACKNLAKQMGGIGRKM